MQFLGHRRSVPLDAVFFTRPFHHQGPLSVRIISRFTRHMLFSQRWRQVLPSWRREEGCRWDRLAKRRSQRLDGESTERFGAGGSGGRREVGHRRVHTEAAAIEVSGGQTGVPLSKEGRRNYTYPRTYC